jgi:hypothetical protein
MKRILSIAALISLLASCTGGGKKVLVMTSGKAEINGSTITLQPGTTHTEMTLIPYGDSITVVTPSETKGFSVKENGYYLLNLKKDTIAGAYQLVGTNNEQKISQEILRARIDSLYQLMLGVNVSEKSRNYNLPPFTIAKITQNTDAQIIGPYVKLPASFDPSVKHEVYKFYTTKEIMEILVKSSKMTQ